MELSIITDVKFRVIECATCGCLFGLPAQLQDRLRNNHGDFYCPNGHCNVYRGETQEEKVRKELKRKEQELANATIEKIQLQNELDKSNRKLKRVQRGVCPCCNRSFGNLANHMATKHPDHTQTKK